MLWPCIATAARNAMPSPVAADPVRPGYGALGVDRYYEVHAADYRNPHEEAVTHLVHAAVSEWQLDTTHVLDLACGSGEVTLALRSLGANRVDGIDPYTGPAYLDRTGHAVESHTFADIAAGALDGRWWTLVVCSFALHLAETSRLPRICRRLADVTDTLVIITPHKRPEFQPGWGWQVPPAELQHERVRARRYQLAERQQ